MTVKVQFVKDYVVYNDQEYKGTDSIGKLCRHLEKEGFGDESLECYRGDMLCMTIAKISERAQKSLQENNKRGLHYRKYRPFPKNL